MNPIIEEDLHAVVEALGEEAKLLEGKTLLLSGGAGFLGSYIVGTIHLLNQKFATPCRVIIVDNYITGSKDSFIHKLLNENIQLVEADVIQPLHIDGPVDFIMHAAGLASPRYYQKFPLETIDVTFLGTRNLLEQAREKGVKSYLCFSSSEVYGDPDPASVPTPETYHGYVSSIGPRACYDESKRLAETLSITYHRTFGVPVKIVRPFNVYGPGMKPDDHRVIPTFMTHALSGKPLPVHDGGNRTRTFCYVSDATTGFFKVLLSGKNGEVYNIGTDTPELTVAALAEMVAGLFPHKVSVELTGYPDSYPKDATNRRCPDLTKVKTQLNYEPRIDLSTGLRRTAAWFRNTLAP